MKACGREKRAVALNSLLAAGAITAFKLVVGISTMSLGILSEAAHSALDLIAAFVTLFQSAFLTNPQTPNINMVTER